ncbi:response regulator [Humisphaera borealis]|uniref:Response regulator n=1 Tax=Humisphaera borealis TaxID=2807512 RepID=A0A7M2WW30_9BACT|nr:response regulator [Humisphaera borealis]QOV89613.1 response regulator [Humisphaera borealis]
MNDTRCKVLVLSGQGRYGPAVDALKATCEVVEAASIDLAIDALRSDQFSAIFSDSADFLPLERALVSQQANLVLNTIGEGVCIVDAEGRCNWMNKKMQAWPARVHEKIRRSCQGSFELFSKQVSPANPETPPAFNRSKRYALNIEDQQFMEMVCSPVINPAGQVVQVVAVVWDATGTRRLQQKVDAIDKAGRELVRIESDLMSKLNVGQRLKLLEEKIISYTKELMHFDHFVVRLLDRRSNRLEPVISVGIPTDALNVELYAEMEGNGISGYVASTGRSYICPDTERDPRYINGLDLAKSSLTVPLTLHDKIIGVFNIESRQRAAFNEDDRQFSEIFARYVAIALNILDLLIVERVSTSHKVADVVCSEVAGPLNDIASDTAALLDVYIGNDELRTRLKAIMENVETIRSSLNQAAQGPNTSVLGAADVVGTEDPLFTGARILVADDEPNIRTTIQNILHKYRAEVTLASNGGEACQILEEKEFDVVLSDIRMPDKNGYEVFACARSKSLTVPVILMTGFGYDPAHSIVRASQEGLQAVLFKPFKVDQLLGELRKALATRVPATV